MSKQGSKAAVFKKYLVLILMMLSMTSIYLLPYLRLYFFTPLQEAMGLMDDTTAYGMLTSVYGIMNLICYIPGGIIADKFDAKKLLVFSMVGTGALGLWMATWPAYTYLMIIQILFGITTVLTFWSSSLKVVNMLAASDEQGQIFGFLEGGRSIVALGVNAVCLAAFTFLATKFTQVKGITAVVIIISVVQIVVGILFAVLLPKTNNETSTTHSAKESLVGIGKCFKSPVTWCLAALIFTCSVMSTTASYYAPYLEGTSGLSSVASSIFSTLRASIITIIAAPFAGIMSKKMGRSTGIMIVACGGLVVLNLVLTATPGLTVPMLALMAIMLLVSFCYANNRAVYWAIIDEAGTPKYMVGTLTGLASMIGFLPDTFLNTLYGSFMDGHEFVTAYRMIFLFAAGASVLGLIGAFFGNKIVKRHQLQAAQEKQAESE